MGGFFFYFGMIKVYNERVRLCENPKIEINNWYSMKIRIRLGDVDADRTEVHQSSQQRLTLIFEEYEK